MAINTGPENLDLRIIEESPDGFFNGVRAAFPLAVLVYWIFHILLRRRRGIRNFTAPEILWLYYGIVCIVASAYAVPWFDYSYWGFAYLSAFAAAEMYMYAISSSRRAADLNILSWVLCSGLIIVILWVARGHLLTETASGLSGYTINLRMPTVAGMPMVRASGLSRLAAVPAIVALPMLWNKRGAAWFFWAVILFSSAYLVWVMQSRGSLTSLGLAFVFVVFLLGGSARRASLGLIALLFAVLMLGIIPNESLHHLWIFATRGTEGRQLTSMSGRTRIFHDAWEAIKAAPIVGYGPQGDRQMSNINNAQNGVLYALLCGGFVGAAGYIGGFLLVWIMLCRVARHRDQLDPADRVMFLQAAGLMAFFTIRSYPENCAALFSIDLLLQLPVIIYIGELDRHLKAITATQRITHLLAAASPFPLPRSARISHYV